MTAGSNSTSYTISSPSRNAYDMLEGPKEEGKIRSIEATHYSHSAFPALMDAMRGRRIDFVQVPYNAAGTTVAREVLPLAVELDLG